MCGGIASCYFNHLVTLFKQKQFHSACIHSFCVHLSFKTKDCFMFGILFLGFFVFFFFWFLFCKIMHYAITNNCSFFLHNWNSLHNLNKSIQTSRLVL